MRTYVTRNQEIDSFITAGNGHHKLNNGSVSMECQKIAVWNNAVATILLAILSRKGHQVAAVGKPDNGSDFCGARESAP